MLEKKLANGVRSPEVRLEALAEACVWEEPGAKFCDTLGHFLFLQINYVDCVLDFYQQCKFENVSRKYFYGMPQLFDILGSLKQTIFLPE